MEPRGLSPSFRECNAFRSGAGPDRLRHLNLLVADDETGDSEIFELAVEKARALIRPQFVRDGQEVVDYLERQPPFGDSVRYPSPEMLLLDLRMPRLDGFEVLEWLQTHELLKTLPVVVFSGSERLADVQRAQNLGASGFIVKPQRIEEFVRVVKALEELWQTLHAPRDATHERAKSIVVRTAELSA